ncbi:MAG: DNA topoisomerase III [Turicibacter sp.]|nr:DNA topoisomerase III [Turicibacter sp.]
MGKLLVLAEKPSVGRDIARVLKCDKGGNGFLEGKDYIVTWALGHLVTLADPEAYGANYKQWKLEELPIIPSYFKLVTIKQTSKQYRTVKDLMQRGDVDAIIVATDAGREGELVAGWIIDKAGIKKPIKRLWISSVTDKAILDGFKSLKPGSEFESLKQAAIARQQADWLVGINATRALTTRYNAELSCGRVQTPTLAMIAHREAEIKAFVPEEFYGLELQAEGINWTWKDSKSGSARVFDQGKVEALKKQISQGKVALVKTASKKQYAPPLYDLTELQRDANQIFGFSAKETLGIAQKLYEQHKVLTYPRTDSRYLSSDLSDTLLDRIKAVTIGPYRAVANSLSRSKLNTGNLINDKKVTDHHAIIPTEETAIFPNLSDKERKIFDLVVKRFLAVLSPPCQFEETKMEAKFSGQKFSAGFKRTVDLGYKAIYGEGAEDGKVTRLQEGSPLTGANVRVTKGKTSPPPYLNEGTLLSAMENPTAFLTGSDKELAKTLVQTGGIGTVATRADIIEKLYGKFFVEKIGQDIRMTAKGKQLLELVPEELKSPALTGTWEKKLRDIESKTLKPAKFIEEIKAYTKKNIENIKASDATFKHDNLTTTRCPQCNDFMLSVNGKRGKMLVCQNRECKTKKMISQTTNARCPNCHKKLELRGEGDKQMFSCVCGHREKMSTFKQRKAEGSKQGNKRDVQRYLREQDKQQDEPMNDAFAALSGLFK